MRSRYALKTTTTVLVALSLQMAPQHAHAGFFNNLLNSLLGKKTGPVTNIDTPNTALSSKKNSYTGVEIFSQIQTNFKTYRATHELEIEVVPVESISNERHSEIKIEVSEKGILVKFFYDAVAQKNPYVALQNLALLNFVAQAPVIMGMESSKIRMPLYSIAELFRNAEAGSLSAAAQMRGLELRVLSMTKLDQRFPDFDKTSERLESLKLTLPEEVSKLNELANAHQKSQQKKLDLWKSETQTLDKYEAMQEKLEALLIKNDRAGVAELLRAYLPWAVMEPVEAASWKVWIDAIEKPDLTKTTVAFRGLNYDTDKIQRRKHANGENFGFMSTVLTKNQGNYNRRLRSLSTNRIKNGDVLLNGKFAISLEATNIRISDQMWTHAGDPKASSFLSFTYDPAVTMQFMGKNIDKVIDGATVSVPHGGMLAVKMDSRRLVPNLTSTFTNEIELLAPLIVFPDEVVKYHEGNFTTAQYQDFIIEVSNKTGIDFTKGLNTQVLDDQSLKQIYRRDGLQFLRDVFDRTSNMRSANYCGKIFAVTE